MYEGIKFQPLVLLLTLLLVAGFSPQTEAAIINNFEAAAISGTVIDEETQTGILNAEIIFSLMPDLQQKTTILTDENGYFAAELPAGEYKVQAGIQWDGYDPETFVPEVLGDIYCTSFNCANDLAASTSLAVQNTSTIDNLDFALAKTASISGQVTDESTASLIEYASVEVEEINTNLSYTHGYSDGNYQIDGLLPGTYKIKTLNYEYINEFYDGHQILSIPATFTPLSIEAATQYTVDFVLEPKPFVSGLVTDEQTGDPIPLALVKLYDLDNNFLGGDSTGSDGSYIIYEVAGSYKLLFDSARHIPELHNNLECPAYQYRLEPDDCQDASSFTNVELALGSPAQVDAQLSSGSRIFGTVTDDETGLPLAGVSLRLVDETGFYVNDSPNKSDENGQFDIFLIPSGRYYLFARPNSTSEYVDEVYDDVPCLSYHCDYKNEATPLDFSAPAVVEINMQLAKGLSISGTVTSERTGLPVTSGLVDAYTVDWNSIPGFGVFAQDGSYSINGLVPGDYFLVFSPTDEKEGYYKEVHDNISCPDWACVYNSPATPVTLEKGGHLIIDAQLINHILYKHGFE